MCSLLTSDAAARDKQNGDSHLIPEALGCNQSAGAPWDTGVQALFFTQFLAGAERVLPAIVQVAQR
jgi:hypothetical protein